MYVAIKMLLAVPYSQFFVRKRLELILSRVLHPRLTTCAAYFDYLPSVSCLRSAARMQAVNRISKSRAMKLHGYDCPEPMDVLNLQTAILPVVG